MRSEDRAPYEGSFSISVSISYAALGDAGELQQLPKPESISGSFRDFHDALNREELQVDAIEDEQYVVYTSWNPEGEGHSVELLIDGKVKSKRFTTRFKKAGPAYKLELAADGKSLSCLNPNGKLQTFVRTP